MKTGRILAMTVLLAAIGIMGYANVLLFEAEQVYKEGNAAYDGLAGQVRKSPNAPPKKPEAPPPPKEQQDSGPIGETDGETPGDAIYNIPDLEIDYETLKTINSDSAAWLYSPGTMIDYPVMAAADYTYYLEHLPDGTKNANGSLFIDYNNAQDFSDPLTVIYGHHMRSGKMFGGLVGYKTQKYYEEHPFMYLYTERGDYRIDLVYGFVIGAEEWRKRAFMYPQNAEALIAYAMENTTFKSGAEYREGDRIVVLSTCSYEFDEARYAVVGILRN